MLAKKFAVGFGIAIIFPMMLHFGVSTFVPAPDWKDYQGDYEWGLGQVQSPESATQLQRQRDIFDEEQRVFQRALFSIAVPVGILVIILGSMLSMPAIGTGLMFGGIFSVLDGYLNYWTELPDSARFVSLLCAFVVLVWVGYRKLSK
jgi:hypothetical protein